MSNYTKATNFATKDALPSGNPLKIVRGTEIDAEFNAIATAIATKPDTTTTPSANLPMGGFKHTNVAVASATTDYLRADQEQNSSLQYLTSVSGTNTITASASIAPAAYAAGQTFRFTSAGANTGAVTLNVNGLGVKSITKNGATALAAGDIPASAVVTVTYDGARFQLSSIASAVEFVSRQTVGAVSAIDFTIPSGYTDFEVSWSLSFSVDAQLLLRSSVDGTTFPSGASDYSTAYIFNSGASGSNIASNASGSIIASPVADAASVGTGSFRLHTANGFRVQGATSLILNAAGAQWEQGVAAGVRNVGTVPLAFRILPSSGTVTGTVTLRGLR